MKILHCCLSCFYIDNYNYQENVLPKLNQEDGHEVLIIASTETFIDNMKLGYISQGEYLTEYGVPLIRVPYKRIITQYLSTKIRKYIGVYKIIDEFKPDVILFHGCCAYELLTVANYVKKNQNVRLYVDSHEDYNNSGRSFLSKSILHRILYKSIIKRALSNIDKVLFITQEARHFLKSMYHLPDDKLEFYPLGGIVYDDSIRGERRDKIRSLLNLDENDILLIHSGKMDKLKRTEDILCAFHNVADINLHLILIGSFEEELKPRLEQLIQQDNRIRFLGWKNSIELLEYLSACDLYVQPGSQSATMQNALCCGSAVAVYPHESHKWLLHDNAFYIMTVEDMEKLFNDIVTNRDILNEMKRKSFSLAKEVLDYKILAQRLYR